MGEALIGAYDRMGLKAVYECVSARWFCQAGKRSTVLRGLQDTVYCCKLPVKPLHLHGWSQQAHSQDLHFFLSTSCAL